MPAPIDDVAQISSQPSVEPVLANVAAPNFLLGGQRVEQQEPFRTPRSQSVDPQELQTRLLEIQHATQQQDSPLITVDRAVESNEPDGDSSTYYTCKSHFTPEDLAPCEDEFVDAVTHQEDLSEEEIQDLLYNYSQSLGRHRSLQTIFEDVEVNKIAQPDATDDYLDPEDDPYAYRQRKRNYNRKRWAYEAYRKEEKLPPYQTIRYFFDALERRMNSRQRQRKQESGDNHVEDAGDQKAATTHHQVDSLPDRRNGSALKDSPAPKDSDARPVGPATAASQGNAPPVSKYPLPKYDSSFRWADDEDLEDLG